MAKSAAARMAQKSVVVNRMKKEERKFEKAKSEIREMLKPNPTPRIPNLALKAGTGTPLITPVPENLHAAGGVARVPVSMSAEAVAFLCLRHFPARLNLWQASVLLGMSEDEIRKLIAYGLLSPLNQGKGTVIYFALEYIQALRSSAAGMAELTSASNQINREENQAKKQLREARHQAKRDQNSD